jgi:hypothetical protein
MFVAFVNADVQCFDRSPWVSSDYLLPSTVITVAITGKLAVLSERQPQ